MLQSGGKINNNLYIGAHTSTKDGIIEGIDYIQTIGGNCAQIFLGSNQSSSLKMKTKLTDSECTRIKRYCQINEFKLFIHAVYVLNLSSFPPTSNRIQYALNNIIYDIEWGYKMGVIGVVVHLGFQKSLSEEEAYQNMANNIVEIVKRTSKSPVKILLETPAGSGTQIGTTISSFVKVLSLIKTQLSNKEFNNRVGVCLDTAHIFSSGHDIRSKDTVESYLKTFTTNLKPIIDKPISLIHLNDSKVELNSRRDVHAGIGQGEIFDKSYSPETLKHFITLIQKMKDTNNKKYIVPMVLETHGAGHEDSIKDSTQYKQEINIVKELVNLSSSKVKEFKLDVKPYSTLKNTISKSKKHSNHHTKIQNKTSTKKQAKPTITKNNYYLLYPNNTKIVKILQLVKDYYHAINETIRSVAYSKAIYQIKSYPYQIKSGSELKHLDGIGEKMIKKIDEIIETGTLNIIKEKNMETTITNYKNKPINMFGEILGFGPSTIKKIVAAKIITIPQLKNELKKPNPRVQLTRLQELGLKYHNQLQEKIPRQEGLKVFEMLDKIYQQIKTTQKNRIIVLPAGSFPSGKMESKDIDVLLVIDDNNPITIKDMIDYFRSMEDFILKKTGLKVLEILSAGENNMMAIIKYEYNDETKIRHLDMKLTTLSNLPYAYLHFTSGVDYNRYIRDKANSLGLKLNDKGLYKLNKLDNKIEDNIIGIDTEDININKITKNQLLKKTKEDIELILNYIGISD